MGEGKRRRKTEWGKLKWRPWKIKKFYFKLWFNPDSDESQFIYLLSRSVKKMFPLLDSVPCSVCPLLTELTLQIRLTWSSLRNFSGYSTTWIIYPQITKNNLTLKGKEILAIGKTLWRSIDKKLIPNQKHGESEELWQHLPRLHRMTSPQLWFWTHKDLGTSLLSHWWQANTSRNASS